MAELNKIFPASSILIQSTIMNVLCFIDGEIVFSDKYSLTSNKLDIYKQSTDCISLFYGYDRGQTYEFNVLLNNAGTIIEGEDKLGNALQGMTDNNILIFVNGKLLTKNDFVILDSGSVALNVAIPENMLQQVFIYVSNYPISYQLLNRHLNPALFTSIEGTFNLNYNINSTLIFLNGIKVNPENILQEGSLVSINLPLEENDIIEVYDLGAEISSLNFYSTFGYTSYGPTDSHDNKIPVYYNTIITFDDVAKLVVDNLRPGFFIKENSDYGGIAVIVDDNFETPKVKCIVENVSFNRSELYEKEYYLEVPTGKNIVDYLSSFDKNYPLLPEILDVFHNTLLREVYDSINRLRDIRNISKVDSYHINKLIKLLGFDTPINTLTLKQKHALIEELNNYYRIVGTKQSYNMFNTIQDEIKIIKLDQLFTPKSNIKAKDNEDNYQHYDYNIKNNTDDPNWAKYYVGNKIYFDIKDYDLTDPQNPVETGIITFEFTVTEVNDQGEIIAVTPEREDGKKYPELTIDQPLKPVNLGLTAQIDTIYNDYLNSYTPGTSSGFTHDNVILTSKDNKYSFKVTGVSNGKITSWEPIQIEPHSNVDITQNGIELILKDTTNVGVKVEATKSSTKLLLDTTGFYEYGVNKSIILSAGTYEYEMSGGAGSGASADSGQDSSADLLAKSGENATRLTGTFKLTSPATLEYVVGGGGREAYARWRKWSSHSHVAAQPGVGYESGQPGTAKASNPSGYSHWGRECASGAGGGSTRIFINNILEKIAPGGKGGEVFTDQYTNTPPGLGGNYSLSRNTSGALGGLGTNPTGSSSYPGNFSPRGKHWSYPGNDGWVKISQVFYSYKPVFTGDQSSVGVGDKFVTPNNEYSVEITSVKDGLITGYNLTAANNSLSHTQTFPLNLIQPSYKATLNIKSTIQKSTYQISSFAGAVESLFEGAKLTAKLAEESLTKFSQYKNMSIPGEIKFLNKESKYVLVDWDLSKVPEKIYNFNNTLLDVDVACGNGATCSVTFITYQDRYAEREYIDFYTKEDLGAEPDTQYLKSTYDYGEIFEGTPNSPNPYVLGKPDYDYGTLMEGVDLSYNYGKITDYVEGEWVDWYVWDRDPKYYPTNHVDIEIKIEASDDQENILNRFYKQFYDLASTVLYIHRLVCSYFFGNSTKDVSVGITSPEESPICFGIQVGQPVVYETISMTSDPARQISTDNLY